MATTTRTNPRKSATQQRSRHTVNALLEATARILVKEGFDKASTNHIADVAGVSVGSLYQYFPSKEALVAALIDRHNQEIMQAVQDGLRGAVSLPIAQGVRKLIAMAVKAHRIDPKLHRVLTEQIPRVGRFENMEAFNRGYYDLFKTYLESRPDETRALDPALASFVCVTCIEALTHTAVLQQKLVSDKGTAALVEEASRLLVGYLTG